MTANELADKLEIEDCCTLDMEAVADMLRQQQAEIEALKANRKHDFGLGEASGFIKGHKENPYKAITNTKIEPTVVSYTHPVKELTDEEIKSVYGEYFDVENCDWLHLQCIQAILRKAQE